MRWMDRMAFFAGIAALLFTAGPVVAQEAPALTIIGAGTSSCRSWTEGRAHGNGNLPNVRVTAQLSWVQGFITALSMDTVRAGGPSITEAATAPVLMSSIDDYCRKHRNDDISLAAINVATQLLKQVQKR